MEDKSLIFSYEYTQPVATAEPTAEQLADMLEEFYELQNDAAIS